MIIGEPYKFAVIFDKVKQWNSTKDDSNGFFALSVEGTLFPNFINNAIINTSLYDIEESLSNIPFDEGIYLMDKKVALEKMYNIVYPSDFSVDNDYRYELAPIALTDEGCFVFAVKGKNKIRILAAILEYDIENSTRLFNDISVSEIILKEDELKEIICNIQKILNI